MKNATHLLGFLFYIFLSILPFCYSQDTCSVTIKHDENTDAGKFAKVNGIRMYYETYGDISKQLCQIKLTSA